MKKSHRGWHSPALVVHCIDSMLAGTPVIQMWHRINHEVSCRNLQRWKKRGKEWRRYKIAKWYLTNKERINKLLSRGVFWEEIMRKCPYPVSPTGYSKETFNAMCCAEEISLVGRDWR